MHAYHIVWSQAHLSLRRNVPSKYSVFPLFMQIKHTSISTIISNCPSTDPRKAQPLQVNPSLALSRNNNVWSKRMYAYLKRDFQGNVSWCSVAVGLHGRVPLMCGLSRSFLDSVFQIFVSLIDEQVMSGVWGTVEHWLVTLESPAVLIKISNVSWWPWLCWHVLCEGTQVGSGQTGCPLTY